MNMKEFTKSLMKDLADLRQEAENLQNHAVKSSVSANFVFKLVEKIENKLNQKEHECPKCLSKMEEDYHDDGDEGDGYQTSGHCLACSNCDLIVPLNYFDNE